MKLTTLVLNSDYRPIGILSWQRSIVLFFKGMEVVSFHEKGVRDSKDRIHLVPSVLRVDRYVKVNFSRVRLNNKNLFARDRNTCQYCGKKFSERLLTVDHVIPKSKWTFSHSYHVWSNVVTACYRCNGKKGDKMLDKSGMKLLCKPKAPKQIDIISARGVPPDWELYLTS